VLNTVLSSRVARVSRVSAMVSVRFNGMLNMVQEFGTAVYRIAKTSLPIKRLFVPSSVDVLFRLCLSRALQPLMSENRLHN